MHLNTCSPSGDDAIQRANSQPAFSQDLFEQVLQRDNILAAWHRVRANKGAPGVDGMTIEAFPAWARSGHWKRTATELRVGQYHPAPVRRVEIDKPDGGKRQLGIPTVTDRVIQQAIAQVLTPIFDPGFSDNSFGFRPPSKRAASGATGTAPHQARPRLCGRCGSVEVLRPGKP